jgi:hypothetical protein
MKLQTTETTEGEGGGLRKPGTFHVVVNDVREGESRKGKPIDGLTVTFEVLAGTVDGQAGTSHTETFFLPSLDDNDKNAAMKLRKLTAMAVATNIVQPDQLGQEVDIPFTQMVGQQIVVKLERQMEKDGAGKYTIETEYVQVSYSDLYHVDDPAVKDVPKNADALGLIAKASRHQESWFAWKQKKAAAPAASRQPVAAMNGADDLF